MHDDPTLPLSAFIICKDEADYLGGCIESLACCAEIVIVDSGSTDGTLDLIESYTAQGYPIRLHERGWPGYAAQKQFALEQCTQQWCLNIDADERLDRALVAALPELLNAPKHVVGWKIARRPFLIGYGYTPERAHERRNLRLIRRGQGAYDLSLKVHEGIVPEGDVKPSQKGSLLHFRPLPLDEQILKENTYSSLKADMQMEKGRQPSLIKLLFSPATYFLRLYFRTGLWRCGVPGLIQAMTGAAYSFMTEAKKFERKALRDGPPVEQGAEVWWRQTQTVSAREVEEEA
ncbi:glycosyltransferase family 2 protein [Notoacmeibacter sp. MSK16QG-6]|uniref:glycosyltransferase family 2 protein n=1 Tax=Notoacmeibacter sp. MSK16QG-6 TaxID=2957982 RepID=UPI0020A035AD|nr:glycosyltransferase family 2 protein [Notoacmeibacter sp. MSK16QG-6]MCP1199840.1 glycosyltransferase family 2 protein [Notoacmeibacter sp. MSK16QG-6]